MADPPTTVVEIEAPTFSIETRERRRNAAANEDEIDDEKAHYLGGSRYAKIKATVRDRKTTIPLKTDSLDYCLLH